MSGAFDLRNALTLLGELITLERETLADDDSANEGHAARQAAYADLVALYEQLRAGTSEESAETVLVYELDPGRCAPTCCFLCLDPGATIYVAREGQSFGARAICTECVSCLVTAGLQGCVRRHLDSDEAQTPPRS